MLKSEIDQVAKDAAFFRNLGTYLYCLQWKMPDHVHNYAWNRQALDRTKRKKIVPKIVPIDETLRPL